MNGYIEETNEYKYLVFDDTYENKELLKRYDEFLMELWVKLKNYMMIDLNMHIPT